jgi:hypothetical protein
VILEWLSRQEASARDFVGIRRWHASNRHAAPN